MSEPNVIRLLTFFLVICLFAGLNSYAESSSENFRLSTDVLDEFGRRASSTDFSLRIGTGGQPAVVALSEDSSFYAWQGYVHTAAFVHGDVNADGNTTIADVVYLMNYVLRGGPEPVPFETGDVDCPDNDIDIVDAVYLVNYLFRGGPPPCNS